MFALPKNWWAMGESMLIEMSNNLTDKQMEDAADDFWQAMMAPSVLGTKEDWAVKYWMGEPGYARPSCVA